jgi:hypothetical protein
MVAVSYIDIDRSFRPVPYFRAEFHSRSVHLHYHLVMSKLSLFRDLWLFMRVRKKWWLLPMILLIALLSLVLIFAQGSAFSPFIYAVF